MRRKRKTPSREELRRLARRRRVAEAWMAGSSAMDIAKAERVSVSAVYADLKLASDVILPAGTKEQLLARNFSRLEDVIRANRAGVEKGDDIATRNAVKAVAEQNRMLGVSNGGGATFTVNTGGDGSINWDIEGRTIRFVKPIPPADDPPTPPHYSNPRLIEYKRSEPVPFSPDPSPPKPPSNPQSGPRTEFDLPEHQRFGFGTRDRKKPPKDWSW